ncbi:MAG: 3-deoxy-7-phosphoheptulonate synthase, partial [Candidatus Magnetoovum sp. WYHC-5]|nr:3-deoxy-7-phosphoheptulonate synthase [Candidatus Magnetoovum sp. WYHC-5]
MDIIVLKQSVTESELDNIVKKLENMGLKTNISKGTERTVIGVIGDTSSISEEETDAFRVTPGVENVMRIMKPYKLASLESKKTHSIINVNGHTIGGQKIPVIA